MQDNITNGLMSMDSPKRYTKSLKNETLKNVKVSRTTSQSLVKKKSYEILYEMSRFQAHNAFNLQVVTKNTFISNETQPIIQIH